MNAATDIVDHLRTLRNPRDIEGQRRYGIAPKGEHLGIRAPVLREIARQHRRDHALALELWTTGLHEARVLAALIDDPAKVTRAQMEQWARECDNWGVTDACCCVLFDRTTFAIEKAHRWSRRRAEFVKRSGFVLMAGLAVHRKELPDKVFLGFLPIIRREATDGRNFVKKAVNWALRQIGKRNPRLRRAAIAEAKRIHRLDSPAARWIATDALRELRK
jgi:3-methyladenine DNA glycosylase AlkD